MLDTIELNKKLQINTSKNIEKYLKFESISLNDDKMQLYFNCLIEKDIEKTELKEYENSLSENLKDFVLSFSYKKIEEKIDIDKLTRDYILKYNPSSKVCIDDININIVDKKVEIFIPNKGLYYSMQNNQLYKQIEKDLSKYDSYSVAISLDKNIKDCSDNDIEDYIENINKEEIDFAKNTDIVNKKSKEKKESKKVKNFKYGKKDILDITNIKDIFINSRVTIKADLFDISSTELKNGKFIISLSLTDHTSSIAAKAFLSKEKNEEFLNNISIGNNYIITGDVSFDNFAKDEVIWIKYLETSSNLIRQDNSKEKRVELKLHSKMSSMNGLTSFDELAKRAKYWGMESLAITDTADVQGFPEAMETSEKYGIKVLYGLDGNFVDDQEKIIKNYNLGKNLHDQDYVVFDIETTGFSPRTDKITEIGAVKIVDGHIVDSYSQLINPEKAIPQKVQELTGLTNAILSDKPTVEEIIEDFRDFTKGCVLVAHNAKFDISFIRREFKKAKFDFDYPVLDTLQLARSCVRGIKRFNLSALSKKLGVSLVGAHRAVNDAQATAEVFIKMLKIVNQEYNINKVNEINNLLKNIDAANLFESSVSILVKNQIGLKNLYKLVSESHLNYVNRVAKIPRTLLDKYRDGLLIGSGNSSSPLFTAIYNGESEENLREIASYYDYLEIQPLDNNMTYISQELVKNLDDLKSINIKIYQLGKKLNIPVVATGDVFYLDEDDDIARRIVLSGQKVKTYRDWNTPKSLYFKNTEEFLIDLSYLGEEAAYEVVVENTNMIADSIDEIKPIPDGKFPPVIEGAEEDLKNMCYKKAHEIYGDDLPEIVSQRLEKELNSIIKNGYSVLYIIAEKLVKKSNDDGYYVGSRGSVGSSFVATMSSITEVNPLPAHYICPNCKTSIFPDDVGSISGIDLEDKDCPNCGSPMRKDGHNIPFEVFLGFYGDKEPDIDLNFAGEYQPRAHKFTEDLFGEGYVFRAGTIGTIAEKIAYGYVKTYFENEDIRKLEIDRLVKKIVGVKRTSGQHPGGIMICPKSKEIYDFTPIQYPADDKRTGTITTHFDYNFIHGKILKLDILGHDGPTFIKMLEDLTKLDPLEVDLSDKETLSLFSSSKILNLNSDIYEASTGTIGIPEFGTDFVMQMLIETKPSTFSELVMISGLSHGTDVWSNNAQLLVKNNEAKLNEVICTREDIMLYLIRAGAENKMAFDTMERVRKGRGLTDEQREIMENLDLPSWYIASCEKIKYMFPKAHAVAYVTLSFRIAYFKIHYPLAYYATYFTIKLQDFDAELILQGPDAIKLKIEGIKNSKDKLSANDKSQITVLEVALEMYARNLEFKNVDLYKSSSNKFQVEDDKILLPFRAYSGIGEQVANNIAESSKNTKYLSIEDFAKKTGATRSNIEILKKNNILKGLPESNQLSLFDL